MDAVPPKPPPAYVYAATDERPRADRRDEVELCRKASRFDWPYFAMPLAFDVGAIAFDSQFNKDPSRAEGFTYLGSGLVGFGLGWTLSGGWLSAPKCSMDWVVSAPPEGNVRADWPIAAAFALLSAIAGPVVVGVETGPIPVDWSVQQRQYRLVFAGLGGVAGALFPYVLPPRTWRAALQLRHLRADTTADGRGGIVSWGMTF